MSKSVAPKNPTKAVEFEEFIKIIDSDVSAHWEDVAKAIGIDSNTVSAWKKHPRAQEAIRKGIERALKCMEQAGARDWRMWEAKLKMLGVNPPSKAELDVKTPIGEILAKYGLKEHAGQTSSTKT